MSNFSLEELRSLIKENLEQSIPSLKEQEGEELKKKGLIQLQKIAAAYKGFSQGDKSASLRRLGGKIASSDPWEVVNKLSEQVDALQIDEATCPEDLIANIILIATLADLLFSDVAGGGSTRGWFMEQYLADVTGGQVLPPSKSEGTADIEAGGNLYSLKQTTDHSIKGSIPEFLYYYGYGLFTKIGEDGKPKGQYFSKIAPSPEREIDYIHFLNKNKGGLVRVYRVNGQEILKSIEQSLLEQAENPGGMVGLERPKNPGNGQELPEQAEVFVPTKNLNKEPLWRGVVNNNNGEVVIKVDLEKAVDIANEQSKQVFEQFNKIVNDFDNLTKAITLFYEDPQEKTKSTAAEQTTTVEDSVRSFVARGCVSQKNT